MGESMIGEVRSLERVREILASARTIAVLGASTKTERPAHYVPDYLHAQGYRVMPVNPLHRGETLWGEPFRVHLQDIAEPVDIVDVFRHPAALPLHLAEFLAMRPAPKVVWFQQGIRNDDVAASLIAAGIEVVQDRCTLADHRGLGLGPVANGR
jgi:predicted CoA-binding protein